MELKFLIVDDDEDVLKVLKSTLEAYGCEVVALSDSLVAAERVNSERFDAVFLDAQMPQMDGFELARQVRKSPSNRRVPIVMLTGFSDGTTMSKGFSAGVTLFLGKPIGGKKLHYLLGGLRGMILQEKRGHARIPLRTVVHCKAGTHQFKSASLDISRGGMLLEGSGGLERRQEMELYFRLPERPEQLNPSVRIIRKDPGDRIAVEFTQMSGDDRKAVEEFISKVVKE